MREDLNIGDMEILRFIFITLCNAAVLGLFAYFCVKQEEKRRFNKLKDKLIDLGWSVNNAVDGREPGMSDVLCVSKDPLVIQADDIDEALIEVIKMAEIYHAINKSK